MVTSQRDGNQDFHPGFPVPFSISQGGHQPPWESYLIQDEPGARACFSYKMSLEERSGMLGVDRHSASAREAEPGTDPGIWGWQRRGSAGRAEPGGGIWMGESDVAAATL